MVASFADFGCDDGSLYRFYLLATCFDSSGYVACGGDVKRRYEAFKRVAGCDGNVREGDDAIDLCIASVVSACRGDGCGDGVVSCGSVGARDGVSTLDLRRGCRCLAFGGRERHGLASETVDGLRCDSDVGEIGVAGCRVEETAGRNVADLVCPEGRSVDNLSAGSVGDLLKADARGKHYKRNRAKALKKKQMGSAARTSIVAESRQDPQRDRAFASCSAETRAELQQSRAEMLIAQNKADKVKAESCVRHYQMVKESRVNETRFELRRQTSEEKLREISKKRLGEGYVEGTVYSSAATPSLSSGSVSPNSSISMAEVKRREELFRNMERRVAALDLEKIAWDEEKKKIEKKYSVYEAQEANRKQLAKERAAIQRSVGMDGYSRWD